MKRILFLWFLVICAFGVAAQTRIVTGKVTSSEDGLGLPGVNVIVPGTTKGSVTDIEGSYSIELVDGENSLGFTFIGYVGQTLKLTNQSILDVALEPDVKMLQDVVVVGYGTQKKSDLTGAVSSVRGADLVKIPSFSPEQALQGKVAGVQVISNTGAPGAPPTIRVRGVGTLNNSSPIFVVDGVILNDISFLNSSDIESMEVLKDASATAIYGSRGANGVIIITSKQGKVGKTVVSVTGDYSLQHLTKKIDLLSGQDFARVVNEINPGTFNNISKVANTDWQDRIFNDFASIQNYQASISGASDKSTFYFGGSYYKQQGIISKSGYERVSIKINNTYKISKAIRIGNNLTISPDKRQDGADVVPIAYRAWPTSVPFNQNGSYAEVRGSGNPDAASQYNNSTYSRTRGVGNVYVDVTLRNFVFKSSYGFDVSYGKSKSFTPAFFVSPQQQNVYSDINVTTNENKVWLWENTLTYNLQHNNHHLNLLGGVTLQKNSSEFLNASGQNLIGNDPSLWYIDATENSTARPRQAGNGGSISSLGSYLFRANYSYHDRYLLTASSRVDGSSKFGTANRYGVFPSVAVGWNIINENFMESVTFLSNLKLRGSWGVIGNEKINQNDRLSLVSNGQGVVFGSDEKLISGATLGNTANKDLKWESTAQTDIGIEVGLFNNKLTAEIDYFHRVTSDILVGINTPGHVGNGSFVVVTKNAAKVLNSGLELNLNWNDQIGDVRYRIGLVGSRIHNEVLKLGASSGQDSFITGGDLGNGQLVTRTEKGKPIGSFYGYEVIGVFQNQNDLDSNPHTDLQGIGDLKFADIHKDGVIDAQDRTYLGSPIPKMVYGFSAEVSYHSLSLAADFQGQSGNKIYNGKMAVRPDLYNFEARVKNRWHGDGTSSTEPRATSGGVNYDQSSYFIESGSFLRLRSLTINYSLPSALSSRMHMSKINVYLRGTNLFTIAKYSGYTPEINQYKKPVRGEYNNEDGDTGVISAGIDHGMYPVTAIYSCGLNLTF